MQPCVTRPLMHPCSREAVSVELDRPRSTLARHLREMGGCCKADLRSTQTAWGCTWAPSAGHRVSRWDRLHSNCRQGLCWAGAAGRLALDILEAGCCCGLCAPHAASTQQARPVTDCRRPSQQPHSRLRRHASVRSRSEQAGAASGRRRRHH